MKAMTCPQCGALIRKISLREKFAECEYCDARILLADNRDKIVEVPDDTQAQPPNNLTPWEEHLENYRRVNERARRYDAPYTYPQKSASASPLTTVLVFVFIFLIAAGGFIMLAVGMFSATPSKRSEKLSLKPTAAPTVSYYPTPQPRINYQVTVKWNGANDMEHFENPEIRNEDLPTLDEKKLKNTVFKNREARVRVTIGTTGEVTSAEGVSGHPVLVKAAVAAAKKSIFNSRAKPTTRVLTYYFRLVSE